MFTQSLGLLLICSLHPRADLSPRTLLLQPKYSPLSFILLKLDKAAYLHSVLLYVVSSCASFSVSLFCISLNASYLQFSSNVPVGEVPPDCNIKLPMDTELLEDEREEKDPGVTSWNLGSKLEICQRLD